MNKFHLSYKDYYNSPLSSSLLNTNKQYGLSIHSSNPEWFIYEITNNSLFTVFLLNHGNQLKHSKIIKDETIILRCAHMMVAYPEYIKEIMIYE